MDAEAVEAAGATEGTEEGMDEGPGDAASVVPVRRTRNAPAQTRAERLDGFGIGGS
jgi:hypothetical protein